MKWEFMGSLGWQIFIGLAGNIVIGFFLMYYDDYLKYQNSNRELSIHIISDLLQDASDVVLELYPPGLNTISEVNSSNLLRDLKKFEGLYWGSLGLLHVKAVEPCLADLHVTLMQATQGFASSSDPKQALRQIQSKLDVTSRALRSEIDGYPSMFICCDIDGSGEHHSCKG